MDELDVQWASERGNMAARPAAVHLSLEGWRHWRLVCLSPDQRRPDSSLGLGARFQLDEQSIGISRNALSSRRFSVAIAKDSNPMGTLCHKRPAREEQFKS